MRLKDRSKRGYVPEKINRREKPNLDLVAGSWLRARREDIKDREGCQLYNLTGVNSEALQKASTSRLTHSTWAD